MNYNLKGAGFAVTDEVRSYVEKKLSALDALVRASAARVDVVAGYLEAEEKQYKVEMTLHDAKEPLHAECRGSTLHEAIDAASAELVDELAKAKKKKLSNFRHSAVRVKEYLRGWRNKI